MKEFNINKKIYWYKRIKSFILFSMTVFLLMLGGVAKDNVIVVQATSQTITVKKADVAIAKKIHKHLYKGKSLTLKVKGDSGTSKRLMKKLMKKVGEVNKYDVVFHYSVGAKTTGYCYYNVSGENAQLYMYSVKLMKRMLKIARNNINEDNRYEKEKTDIKSYPDENQRKLHVMYDSLVSYILDYPLYEDYAITGYDEPTTVSKLYINSLFNKFNVFSLIMNYKSDNEIMLYSYDEFILTNDEETLLEFAEFSFLDNAEKKVMSTPFYKLSDAMKVYVVDRSFWFVGVYEEFCIGKSYGVKYSYTKSTPTSGSIGMKHLYNGESYGVCVQYALYECLLWEQLGIEGYYNSSSKINHAWSVVKVKNSKGKTLWIPFDYGIGPTMGGDTEKECYRLYLNGIKGAPKKKNWKWSDFN